MSNCIFAWPMYGDPGYLFSPVLSGGSWLTANPLTNLQDRRLARVARSSSTANNDTLFSIDLQTDRQVGVVALPKHTISQAGRARVVGLPSSMLFDYEVGDNLAQKGATFTRASTATYVDANGILQTAASGVARDGHYVNGVRGLLLEKSRTNSILQSRDQTNASWTPGTATTARTAVGLDGTANSATVCTDSSATVIGILSQGVTVPVDSNTHTISFWVAKDSVTSRFPLLYAQIGGGTVVSRGVHLNTQTGATVATNIAGTTTSRVVDAGLWWVVELTLTNNSTVGNTGLSVQIYPARSTVIGTDNVAAVGSVTIGHVQVELASLFYSSPIFTTTTTVTRSDDALSFPISFAEQALTAYGKWTDLGSQLGGAGSFSIGDFNVRPGIIVYHSSSTAVSSAFHNGTAQVNGGTFSSGIVYGDSVEARLLFTLSGTVQRGSARNGGAETLGVASAGQALGSGWGGSKVLVNDYDTSHKGFASFQSIRIMTGVQSLATMRAAVYDSGWVTPWPSGATLETLTGLNVAAVFIVPASFNPARIWTVQIDDTTNPTGFVDVARLVIAGGYQPSVNLSIGAKAGIETDTVRIVTDGGASIFQTKPIRRNDVFTIDKLAQSETFATIRKMQRLLGISGQFFFVFDPADTTLMFERAYLCVLKQLDPIDHPVFQLRTIPFSLVEEL